MGVYLSFLEQEGLWRGVGAWWGRRAPSCTWGQSPETLCLQPPPALELEALRLSLSNMHTAQLELTQANLQREKETALVELRDMLNGRHAQELALVQSRQQLELEQAREQHAREREALALRCSQETGTAPLPRSASALAGSVCSVPSSGCAAYWTRASCMQESVGPAVPHWVQDTSCCGPGTLQRCFSDLV